jgi:hypothetical protein
VNISVVNISVSERWLTPYAPPRVGSRASSKKIRESVHVRIGFIQIGCFGIAGGAAAMTPGAPAFARAAAAPGRTTCGLAWQGSTRSSERIVWCRPRQRS